MHGRTIIQYKKVEVEGKREIKRWRGRGHVNCIVFVIYFKRTNNQSEVNSIQHKVLFDCLFCVCLLLLLVVFCCVCVCVCVCVCFIFVLFLFCVCFCFVLFWCFFLLCAVWYFNFKPNNMSICNECLYSKVDGYAVLTYKNISLPC